MSDLKKKIEALGKKSDKKALVKLGADELRVDLDSSKTAAVLAEELLAIIEERGEAGSDETHSSEEQGGETDQDASEKEDQAEGDQDSPPDDEQKEPPASTQKVSDSTTGDRVGKTVGPLVSDSTTGKKRYRGKQLKNTKNGRLFPWTAALAKKRNMSEV